MKIEKERRVVYYLNKIKRRRFEKVNQVKFRHPQPFPMRLEVK